MSDSAPRALHADVTSLLADLRSDLGAAEAHGMLVGMLSHPAGFDTAVWLSSVLGEDYAAQLRRLGASNALLAMVEATLRELADAQFELQLLLPGDEHTLSARAAALGLWCQGFLTGFGLAGKPPRLQSEAREYLTDLSRICQLDPRETRSEDGEQAYNELVEYVRMGALMLYETHRPENAPPAHSVH